MQNTYTIPTDKAEEYYTRYKKRRIINTITGIGWAVCIIIGIKYNLSIVPAIAFSTTLIFTVLLRLGFRRRSWGNKTDETREYLNSTFALNNEGIERIYNEKTVANVRFKSKYTLTESRWGIEVRTYTLSKYRPFEKLSAEVSDRMYINFDSYYNIFIPTVVNDYEELKAQLYLKLPAAKV